MRHRNTDTHTILACPSAWFLFKVPRYPQSSSPGARAACPHPITIVSRPMTTSWFLRRFSRTAPPSKTPSVTLECLRLEDRITPYNLGTRWTRTATDGIGLQQGDPTTLRWSILPDGVSIPGDPTTGELTSPSTLIATLDARFGAGPGGSDLTRRPWFHLFTDCYDRLSELSGLTYVYEPAEDGAPIAANDIGIINVRGDIRIGGLVTHGPPRRPACSVHPHLSAVE